MFHNRRRNAGPVQAEAAKAGVILALVYSEDGGLSHLFIKLLINFRSGGQRKCVLSNTSTNQNDRLLTNNRLR